MPPSAYAGFTEAALPWATRGIPVFPVQVRGKRPYTEHGFKDATTDEEQIRAWGKRWPNARVGIDLERAGMMVLDVDPRHGGDVALEQLVTEHGLLPHTWCALTPGGGQHHSFRNRDGLRSCKITPGIEIKAVGGYVIVPPSPGYRWWDHSSPDDCGLADPASWLLDVVQRQRQSKTSDWEPLDVESIFEGVPAGQRDDTAYRYASSLRARSVKLPEAVALMRHMWEQVQQPEGDEFTLVTALEKVRRVYREKPEGRSPKFQARSEWPAAMDEDAFSGVLGDFVRTVEPHSEASREALLTQAAVMLGNAMGLRPGWRVEATRHALILFANLVGDTAVARKGTSFDRARQFILGADPDYESRITQGISTAEGLLSMLRNDEEEDFTVSVHGEEIQSVRAGSQDRRLMVVESEFAALLRRMHRKDNVLSPVLRSLWDHGSARVGTKVDPIEVTGAHVSLITHITGIELTAEFTTTDMANGFGNRCLWICTTRARSLPRGGNLGPHDLDSVTDQIKAVLDFADVEAPQEYDFDQSTGLLWDQEYERLHEAVDASLLGLITSRGPAIVRRLAVLYAVADLEVVIREQHLRAALAVWDYSRRSAEYLFGAATGNVIADKVYRFAGDRPAGITRTEISKLFSGNVTKAQIDEALDLLQRRGLMRTLKQGRGRGRPREIWQATIYPGPGADANDDEN